MQNVTALLYITINFLENAIKALNLQLNAYSYLKLVHKVSALIGF